MSGGRRAVTLRKGEEYVELLLETFVDGQFVCGPFRIWWVFRKDKEIVCRNNFFGAIFQRNNPKRALLSYPNTKLLFFGSRSFTILLFFKLVMEDLITDLLDLAA